MKNYYGWNSCVVVQNTTSTSTNIYFDYYPYGTPWDPYPYGKVTRGPSPWVPGQPSPSASQTATMDCPLTGVDQPSCEPTRQ